MNGFMNFSFFGRVCFSLLFYITLSCFGSVARAMPMNSSNSTSTEPPTTPDPIVTISDLPDCNAISDTEHEDLSQFRTACTTHFDETMHSNGITIFRSGSNNRITINEINDADTNHQHRLYIFEARRAEGVATYELVGDRVGDTRLAPTLMPHFSSFVGSGGSEPNDPKPILSILDEDEPNELTAALQLDGYADFRLADIEIDNTHNPAFNVLLVVGARSVIMKNVILRADSLETHDTSSGVITGSGVITESDVIAGVRLSPPCSVTDANLPYYEMDHTVVNLESHNNTGADGWHIFKSCGAGNKPFIKMHHSDVVFHPPQSALADNTYVPRVSVFANFYTEGDGGIFNIVPGSVCNTVRLSNNRDLTNGHVLDVRENSPPLLANTYTQEPNLVTGAIGFKNGRGWYWGEDVTTVGAYAGILRPACDVFTATNTDVRCPEPSTSTCSGMLLPTATASNSFSLTNTQPTHGITSTSGTIHITATSPTAPPTAATTVTATATPTVRPTSIPVCHHFPEGTPDHLICDKVLSSFALDRQPDRVVKVPEIGGPLASHLSQSNTLYILDSTYSNGRQAHYSLPANFQMPANSRLASNHTGGINALITLDNGYAIPGSLISATEENSQYGFYFLDIAITGDNRLSQVLDLRGSSRVEFYGCTLKATTTSASTTLNLIRGGCTAEETIPQYHFFLTRFELDLSDSSLHRGYALVISGCDALDREAQIELDKADLSVKSNSHSITQQGYYFYLSGGQENLRISNGSTCNRIVNENGIDISTGFNWWLAPQPAYTRKFLQGAVGLRNGKAFGMFQSGNGERYLLAQEPWCYWKSIAPQIEVECPGSISPVCSSSILSTIISPTSQATGTLVPTPQAISGSSSDDNDNSLALALGIGIPVIVIAGLWETALGVIYHYKGQYSSSSTVRWAFHILSLSLTYSMQIYYDRHSDSEKMLPKTDDRSDDNALFADNPAFNPDM